VTPDERYFVVKESFGASAIPVSKRGRLLRTLMEARHAVKDAKSAGTAMQSWKVTDGSTKRSAPSASVAPFGGTTARPTSTATP
jgi:hypothetical protein